MDRFFVPPESVKSNTVTLPPAVSRQLSTVLRARVGETIALLDNTGAEYIARLTRISTTDATADVVSKSFPDTESRVKIHLYQGLLKEPRFELALQKATELGVASITPVKLQRSVVELSAGQHARWQRIVQEAAEQSERAVMPELQTGTELNPAFSTGPGLLLVPWEEENSLSIKSALLKIGGAEKISLLIGAEGGITTDEIAYVRSKGGVTVSLGKRILRAETAVIVALSIMMYEMGDMK
ncbi:MAG: 16S rRNA (uracil(1498)-N(3))-methyltransferase [Dehalococcoidia bacterium]|nr:16S rRNA (uracil(1498)-N(3))-methyltransferase [Dehalococcoidia bacterium]